MKLAGRHDPEGQFTICRKKGGGRYWDRTSDPFDVNEVLSR